ncbi:MAG: 5-formyltetrahydrofolate cyclo-ligase [Nocardioidaceae bacterium]
MAEHGNREDLGGTRAEKQRTRDAAHERRRRRTAAECRSVAEALRDRVLDLPEVVAARTVAVYVSLPSEPGTAPLVRALLDRRTTVLAPVLLPDHDLDWAVLEADAVLRRSAAGTDEPTAPTLGVDAIAAAEVVIVPALAVDAEGNRLGRGGGSYDRALRRTTPPTLTVALVRDDDLVDVVPADVHDQRVDVVVTPTRLLRVTTTGPGRAAGDRPWSRPPPTG